MKTEYGVLPVEMVLDGMLRVPGDTSFRNHCWPLSPLQVFCHTGRESRKAKAAEKINDTSPGDESSQDYQRWPPWRRKESVICAPEWRSVSIMSRGHRECAGQSQCPTKGITRRSPSL